MCAFIMVDTHGGLEIFKSYGMYSIPDDRGGYNPASTGYRSRYCGQSTALQDGVGLTKKIFMTKGINKKKIWEAK